MIGRWQQALQRIWSATPYGLDELSAGCGGECGPWVHWPLRTVAGYVYAAYLLVYLVAHVSWSWPRITSGHRCPPCNARRGGVPGSRHQGQLGQGEPYAAFDIQWETTAEPQRLYQLAQTGQLQDRFRRWIGANVGIGLIFYGRRIHADVRDSDYLELKDGAW